MDTDEELYEVVISGISGKFPASDDVDQLKENLLAKKNLVTEQNCRWNRKKWNVPAAIGKISVVEKFDDTFFGIYSGIAAMMDPLTRITIERAYEAVMDAGINPKQLKGSNTAVYTASGTSDSEAIGCDEKLTTKFWLLAHVRALLANRISYVLNLQGPSWTIDSTWIGGIECLKRAVDDIKKGRVESALVGVSNVILFPEISVPWQGLGKLSPNGTCSPYEENANGYGRSEAVVFLFLQRQSEAKRIYTKIINADTMFCGDEAETLLKPKKEAFVKFLKNFYSHQSTLSKPVAFIEADGSADKYLDEIELNSIGQVLCDEKGNKNILIGNIKSNLGHAEAASPFVSLTKALIAMDTEIIPPNRQFIKANKRIPSLQSKDLKVLTTSTPYPEGQYTAVNTVGLCSSIGHVLLEQCPKRKKRQQIEKTLPRLILVTARHESGLLHIINKLEAMPYDDEYFAMVNDVFKESITGHFFRGFTILGATEKKMHFTLEAGTALRRPIWFVFAGMGSQWPGMGADLMNIPVFAAAIYELDTYLSPLGIDIVNVITNYDPTVLKVVVNCFVGIVAVQIGLVDVLKTMGIEPDGMFGHSLGENMCAYVDGSFNKYQAIMAAYYRGRASSEVHVRKGLMAAVGLHYSRLTNLPPNVEIGCHNSYDNTTISGPLDEMQAYVDELKRQNIFVRVVNSNNVAYHSRQVAPLAPYLLENIRKIVPNPVKRSTKWISTSVLEQDWDSPLAQCSSAEYHVNNFQHTVYFAEACAHIPENAVIIEISPHGLFQGILKRVAHDSCFVIPMGKRETSSSLNFFLSSIGKLFVVGLQPDVNAIHPPTEFPVSRGTPSLATLATWNHEMDWEINVYKNEVTLKPLEVNLRKREWRFLMGYTVNGKIFMPFSLLLIETLKAYETKGPILIFENVHISNYAEISVGETDTIFNIQVQYGSGNFEITNGDQVQLNGSLRYSQESIDIVDDDSGDMEQNNDDDDDQENLNITFSQNEIEKVLKEYSINFADQISNASKIIFTEYGYSAFITWGGKLADFINAIAISKIFWDVCLTNKCCLLTHKFSKFAIETETYNNMEIGTTIRLVYDRRTNALTGAGVQMIGLENSYQTGLVNESNLMFQSMQFVDYDDPQIKTLENFLMLCGQLVGENLAANINSIGKTDDDRISLVKLLLMDDLQSDKMLNKKMAYLFKMLLQEIPQAQTNAKYTSYEDLEYLQKYGNDCAGYFIIGKNIRKYADHISKLAESAYNVFLLTLEETPTLPEVFVRVTGERIGTSDVILWKKKIPLMETIFQIKPHNNKHWLEDLQDDLRRTSTQNQVRLQWQSKSLTEITDIVSQICMTRPLHFIRFVVSTEEINFENDSKHAHNSSAYRKHMRKGLTMNIYKSGKWGSVRHLMPTNSFSSTSALQSCIERSKSLEKISIEFMILNSETEKQTDRKIFEFSGLESENRKKVMGIADYKNDDTSDINTFLQWQAPEQWTLEDAVTVPLPYVKAYYSLIEKGKLSRRSSVLVHHGYSIFGEASIAIALSFDCMVYTSVTETLQGKYLKERFRHSSHLNILNSESQQIDIEILKSTKKSGVDIVINAETEAEVRQSLECLLHYGKLILVSDRHLKLGNKFGMESFLRTTTVCSIIDEEFIKCDDKVKSRAQKWLNESLKCGIIKPFKRYVHRSNELNIDLLRSRSKKDDRRRTVIRVKADSNKKQNIAAVSTSTFLCDPNKFYLIAGSKDAIWFMVVTWLLENNAKKFVFVEEQSQDYDTQYMKRFNLYLASRTDLSFMYVSASRLKSQQMAVDMIQEVNAYAPLDVVFCLSLDSNRCSNIDRGLQHNANHTRQFICLQCDASDMCESRIQSGFSALNVIWDRSITESALLIKNLKKIIENALQINSPLFYISRQSHFEDTFESLLAKVDSYFLPHFSEAASFMDSFSTQASFEKVVSKCSYYSTCTQLFPVFILPGLHSRKLKSLIRKIMYPVFCAKYPTTYSSAKSVAKTLLQPIKEIQPKGPYTIVGESWSGVIAIELVSLLEQDDAENKVNLILIEGMPKTLRERLAYMGSLGSPEFLNNLQEICFGNKSREGEQLDINCKSYTRDRKSQFLELLQRKLTTAYDYLSEKAFLRSEVFAVNLVEMSVLDTYIDFEQHYGNKLELKSVDACNYENLLNSDSTATIINRNVLFKW